MKEELPTFLFARDGPLGCIQAIMEAMAWASQAIAEWSAWSSTESAGIRVALLAPVLISVRERGVVEGRIDPRDT